VDEKVIYRNITIRKAYPDSTKSGIELSPVDINAKFLIPEKYRYINQINL
jgi:hypothetical protein